MPTDWSSQILNPTTVIGVLALVVALVIWWRRDASNPAQAASYGVVTASAEYAGDAFRVASEAMKAAQEANARALSAENRALQAEIASARCSAANQAMSEYVAILVDHIEDNGLVPPRAPAGLTDWVTPEDHQG